MPDYFLNFGIPYLKDFLKKLSSFGVYRICIEHNGEWIQAEGDDYIKVKPGVLLKGKWHIFNQSENYTSFFFGEHILLDKRLKEGFKLGLTEWKGHRGGHKLEKW